MDTTAELPRTEGFLDAAVCPASREVNHGAGDQTVRLTIVVPALNEEAAIGQTIERCLAARTDIIAGSGVSEVQVVVVSDGSTDDTARIARRYDEVTVIEFEHNRGYGAAIKEGWRRDGGDLLAFLDADGTCDPKYFTEMCRIAVEENADIVVACRMGADSRMPPIRRLGNRLFALMLGLLSRKDVTDSASGMRVVRAEALPRLLPLPNGLDFTPSMSARALMDHSLSVREVPMKYEERIGESKLSVVRDGLRFTREILSAAAYVKPSRITLPIAVVLAILCGGLSISPIRHYAEHGSLPEWMVYRFLAMAFGGAAIITLLCATVVAEHVIAVSQLRYESFLDCHRPWWGRRARQTYVVMSAAFVTAAVVLIWPGLVSYLRTRHIPAETLHWSRVVVAGFFLLTFWQMAATACILRIIPAIYDRQRLLLSSDPPLT